MKTCIRCKIERNLFEFSKDKREVIGLRSVCKECDKQYYLLNKEQNKKYQIENKENKKVYNKQYNLNNKYKKKIYNKEYFKNRRLNDPLFKLTHNTRSLVNMLFKRHGYTKKSKTYEILGCSYEEFKAHLESQFTDGMTWDNQGKWHLDHIIPISSAKTEEEIIKLNHYTNFQPLWAEDNLRKGNKI